MKKDTSHMIRRAEHFKTILTGEGFLVGLIAGLVVLLYRVLLEFAGKWMNLILQYGRENPVIAGGWFLLLAVMACIVGKLVKWEPMISGSGIPQVEGEMMGKLTQRWWRILPAKFFGRFSLSPGRSFSGERGSVYPDRSYGRKSSVESIGQRENRREVSAYLRSKRRSGSSISRPSRGSHVFS